MKYTVFTSFLFLFCSCFINSKTSVWLVEGKGTKLYIGGTIHQLREKDYPLPEKFSKAFNDSEIIVKESDGYELQKPENYRRIVELGEYKDNRTLKSVLDKEVYFDLEVVAQKYNIDLLRMNTYKPFTVALGFISQVFKENGITADGVEAHFEKRAKEENKTVLYLETFENSLKFFDSLNQTNENDLIKYLLNDLDNIEKFEVLIYNWEKGNEKLMLKEIEEFKQNFPELYHTLLIERNYSWLPKIESFLNSDETEFVLFGAMHLYGTEGVLQLLKNKGYRVRQL